MREATGVRGIVRKRGKLRDIKKNYEKKEKYCVLGCVLAREKAFHIKLGCDFPQPSRFGTEKLAQSVKVFGYCLCRYR